MKPSTQYTVKGRLYNMEDGRVLGTVSIIFIVFSANEMLSPVFKSVASVVIFGK